MKVAGYPQNNLSKSTFGMNIDFHADDMRTYGVNLPKYSEMNAARAITNANPIVRFLCPKTVSIKYIGEVPEFRSPTQQHLGKHLVDTWTLVADGITSATIKIQRDLKDGVKIADILIDAAKDFAQQCYDLRKLAQEAANASGAEVKSLLH